MLRSKPVLMLFGMFVLIITVYSGVRVGQAEPVATIEDRTVADSEDSSWDRRIYSYDMGVDSAGNVHIVYLKPSTGNSGDIYYSRRNAGIWTEQKLTADGLKGSISMFLLVDSKDKVHICYVKNDEHLYYRTISNGAVSREVKVQDGGWHTRMQLDKNNRAVFVRGRNGSIKKLDILTTTDDLTWDQHYWDIPGLNNSLRLGGFVYDSGTYHVIYGDSAILKSVVSGGSGIFHNLYYASSSDGVNWSNKVVDSSATLYENEFWTSIIVDNGYPVISWYSYAEYGGQYNTGTSAWYARWTGSSWQKKDITESSYPETREGMGVDLVRHSANIYFGGWDFSPDNTYDNDFRGARGNIALKMSGRDGLWSSKWQLAEYSAEGEVKLCIRNNRLFFLVLGDYLDTKLYFKEYNMDLFFASLPSTPGSGKAVAPVSILLLRNLPR